MTDYLFDKTGEDPEVAQLEQLLAGHAHRAPLRTSPVRRFRWPMAAAASLTAAAAAIAFVFMGEPEDRRILACELGGVGFGFVSEGGLAQCGGGSSDSGVLPVGEWLETSVAVSAQLKIAEIGELTIHGGSRVRLVGTGPSEHRLELERGRISAQVVAPPRLFIVDTPDASAVDLGCAYELAVNDEGRTDLWVTAGAVSLEGHGLLAYVGAGSRVSSVAGRGPGTPIATGASPALQRAVARFDAGEAHALPDLLAAAEASDAGTLWNLLRRTEGDARGAVYGRLTSLHPHPASISSRAILEGDSVALDAWREDLAL